MSRGRCGLMRIVLPVFVACLVISPAWSDDTEPMLAMSVSIQAVSGDPEASGGALTAFADASGGYFTYRSLDSVVLRIPADTVPELRALIEDLGDTIVAYNPSMHDYSEEYVNLEAAISSRREALDRILEYVGDATVTATLEFERELRSLSQEIDNYTGRQREIVNNVTYASVWVGLTTRQSTIPNKIPSSFGWINTIDLYQFVDQIRYSGAQ